MKINILKMISISIIICLLSINTIFAGKDTEYLFENKDLYSYEDMQKDLNLLKKENPDILLESIAKTVDDREIYHVCIGNIKAKKHILITASIHAREYISTKLVMRQMADILEKLDSSYSEKDKKLSSVLDEVAIHFVPMVNPDGVTLSQFGLSKINKEENKALIENIYKLDKAKDKSTYLKRWKSNIRGIDLNRNFDAKWDEYNDKVYHPSSDHYKGKTYESEIESKTLVDLTKKYQFKRTISYHTQGEVIYWYFAQEGNLLEESKNFAKLISKETGYSLDSDYKKLDSAGYKDYAIYKLKIPSLTVEIGTGTSPVDEKQIDKIWKENKNVCISSLYSLLEK